MKILYYFTNYDSLMFQWQRFHIFDEMKIHGCYFDILSPVNYPDVHSANEAIKAYFDNNRCDLFMTCLNDDYLDIEVLSYAKKKGIPTLLFCPDNLVAPFNHKKVSPHFDLVWLTSIETEYLFKKWGCKTVFLPYAANPFFLQPNNNELDIPRIAFIGTPHGSRIHRLNSLIKAGLPVTIHTSASNLELPLINASARDYIKKFSAYLRYPIGYKLGYSTIIDKLSKPTLLTGYDNLQVADAVPLEQLANYNSRYALILSITDANSTGILKNPVKIVNLRNFEIPMSGGLQFTLYSDELASYFTNDKEIVMGKTIEECIEKARFYLKDENADLRIKMKENARKRAEKEHTWFNRFSRIFQILGIKNE